MRRSNFHTYRYTLSYIFKNPLHITCHILCEYVSSYHSYFFRPFNTNRRSYVRKIQPKIKVIERVKLYDILFREDCQCNLLLNDNCSCFFVNNSRRWCPFHRQKSRKYDPLRLFSLHFLDCISREQIKTPFVSF